MWRIWLFIICTLRSSSGEKPEENHFISTMLPNWTLEAQIANESEMTSLLPPEKTATTTHTPRIRSGGVKYIYIPNLKDVKNNFTKNFGNIFIPTNAFGSVTNFSNSTNVYIIGVVGVIPAAGAVFWCIRRLISKKSKGRRGNNKREMTPFSVPRTFIKFSRSQDAVTDIPSMPAKISETVLDYTAGKLEPRRPKTWKKNPGVWEMPREKLSLLHVLGEGYFGQVWKAEARQVYGFSSSLIVAVKTVKDNANTKEKEDLLKELNIMQQLDPHPNVVTLLGCCTTEEPYYVVLEYIAQGKLLSFLRDHRSRRKYYNCPVSPLGLSSHDLTMFAYHVASGMSFISNQGILHRDLAARNILVDCNNVCKVADFGLSKSIRETDNQVYEQKTKGALPIRWMAPESLYMNVFTVKTDSWAFGILLWEIVTLGSTPYPGMGAREVIQFVRDGQVMECPDHCRPELYHVMKECWSTDPNNRPNFQQLQTQLAALLAVQTGYVDLEHFPEQRYYNLYQSTGEKV